MTLDLIDRRVVLTSSACGCDGIAVHTTEPINNRPGLSALSYRRGVHGTLFESLLARIATYGLEAGKARKLGSGKLLRELLTTRELRDGAIALFDAWATVADVISFYQERLANEGFLYTAEEDRSLYELSRLVGYRPRPGLASTVYLAFEVDPPALPSAATVRTTGRPIVRPPAPPSTDVIIPEGTKAKSTPTPGSDEEPQTFETTYDLAARPEWNAIRPRASRPQRLTDKNVGDIPQIYFKGLGLRLNANDRLALRPCPLVSPTIRRIAEVEEIAELQITKAVLAFEALSAVGAYQDLARIRAELKDTIEPDSDVQNSAAWNSAVRTSREILDRMQESYSAVSLETLDNFINEEIKVRLLSDSALRGLISWLKTAADSATIPKSVRNLLDTSEVLKSFQSVVKTHLDGYIATDQSLEAIATALNDTTDEAKRQSRALSVISSKIAKLASSPTPQISLAGRREAVVAPLAPLSLVYITYENSLEQASTYSAEIEVLATRPSTLKFSLTDTNFSLNGARIETSTTPGSQNSLKNLATALANVAIDAAGIDANMLIRIFAGDAAHGGVHLIAEGIQPALPAGATKSTQCQFGARRRIKVVGCDDNDRLNLSLSAPVEGQTPTIGGVRLRLASAGVASASAGKLTLTDGRLTLEAISGSSSVYELKPNNASATFGEYSIALANIRFLSPADPAHFYLLVEAFSTTVPSDASNHDNCVGSCLIEIYSVKGLTLAGSVHDSHAFAALDQLTKNYSDLTELGSLQEVKDFAEKFAENAWPGPASGAQKYGDWINNTLCKSVKEAQSFDQAVASLRLFVHGDFSPLSWARRLRELRSQLGRLMNATAKEGAAPSALQIEANQSMGLIPFIKKKRTEIQDIVAPLQDVDFRTRLGNALDLTLQRVEAVLSLGGPSPALLYEANDAINYESDSLDTLAEHLSKTKTHLTADVDRCLELFRSALRPVRFDFANRVAQAAKRAYDGLGGKSPPESARRPSEYLNTISENFSKLFPAPDSTSTESAAAFFEDARLPLREQATTLKKHMHVSEPPTLADEGAKLTGELRATVETAVDQFNALLTRITNVPDLGSSTPQVRSIPEAIAVVNTLRPETRGADLSSLVLDIFRLTDPTSDLVSQISKNLNTTQRALLYDYLANTTVTDPERRPDVFVFRNQANLFGWSAVNSDRVEELLTGCGIADVANVTLCLRPLFGIEILEDDEAPTTLFLDGAFPLTVAGTPIGLYIYTGVGDDEFHTLEVRKSLVGPRVAYGLKGNATRLDLSGTWRIPSSNAVANTRAHDDAKTFEKLVRKARVLCDAERLELAERSEDPYLTTGDSVECDGVVPGLDAGRKLVIEGIHLIAGVETTAPARQMLEVVDIDHNINGDLFGDRFCTTITFSPPLTAQYRRDSVRIYANVVEATHGETASEVIGGGDAAKAFQQMPLARRELTHVPAPTPTGDEPKLSVEVNDVRWTPREDFEDSSATCEHYLAIGDDARRTTIQFGDGVAGARLPTGIENVRSTYRSGLGRKGNVTAGQIDQLVGAPLGAKKVINPLPAQGGADPDAVRDIRKRAALAVTAMDRLVSRDDYAAFARNFAGVGKASAALIGGVVQVTVAGLDERPFDVDGPILRSLQQAMSNYGDPSQQFRIHNREAALLIVVANVRIDPRRQWAKIEPLMRAALLDQFSYENAELGKDMLLSDAIKTIQAIAGVDYIDVDVFDAVEQADFADIAGRLGSLARRPRIHVALERLAAPRPQGKPIASDANLPSAPVAPASGSIADTQGAKKAADSRSRSSFRPAQVCFLPKDIPSALLLEQVP